MGGIINLLKYKRNWTPVYHFTTMLYDCLCAFG